MKSYLAAVLLAAFAILPAQAQTGPAPGKAAPVCIRPFDNNTGSLDHTKVLNPTTIVFYMRDGKVWKNTLKAPCPALQFHGFSYVTHQDEVCSNAQAIQVLVTGEICQLGEFTPYTPPSKL